VLHHVSLEVPGAEVERMAEFWGILGFERIPAAEAVVAEYVTWFERGDQHVHLIHTDEPGVPLLGHAAFAVDDFDDTVRSLRAAGFEVQDAQELWGEPRAFAIAPGGHRVEVMGAAPPRSRP
jgi:catechol 2,3-dioxygenase-like lactoylglutathione lyase family enzyme